MGTTEALPYTSKDLERTLLNFKLQKRIEEHRKKIEKVNNNQIKNTRLKSENSE